MPVTKSCVTIIYPFYWQYSAKQVNTKYYSFYWLFWQSVLKPLRSKKYVLGYRTSTRFGDLTNKMSWAKSSPNWQGSTKCLCPYTLIIPLLTWCVWKHSWHDLGCYQSQHNLQLRYIMVLPYPYNIISSWPILVRGVWTVPHTLCLHGV